MVTTFEEEAVNFVIGLVVWVVTDVSDTAAHRRVTGSHSAQN
jgi:hypothetical protein